jgi:hypothetical protein
LSKPTAMRLAKDEWVRECENLPYPLFLLSLLLCMLDSDSAK